MTKNKINLKEWILFILKKQLESKLLADDLHNIGLDGSRTDIDFSDLIFEYFGIDDTDNDVEWYFNHLDMLVKKLKYNELVGQLDKVAKSFYLLLQKEQLSSNKRTH